MNFMQSTCVALWQHSEKDIFFFLFQAPHEARCLIRRFALLGGLMRLMGFICPESVVYISPPRGQGFTDTRCGNFYRFHSILTQAPRRWLRNGSGCRVLQNFAKASDFSMEQLAATTSPLLFPSGPLRMVHSSMHPKDSKRRRTSSSDCCLLSMPTKSFLSSERKRNGSRSEEQKYTHSLKEKTFFPRLAVVAHSIFAELRTSYR